MLFEKTDLAFFRSFSTSGMKKKKKIFDGERFAILSNDGQRSRMKQETVKRKRAKKGGRKKLQIDTLQLNTFAQYRKKQCSVCRKNVPKSRFFTCVEDPKTKHQPESSEFV